MRAAVEGAVARAIAGVNVSAIEGKAGWLVRSALVDRLGAGAAGEPRYRLDVRLDEQLKGLGLLSNDAVTRERRTLRARYQLVDLASGDILLDATVGADAGVDIVVKRICRDRRRADRAGEPQRRGCRTDR